MDTKNKATTQIKSRCQLCIQSPSKSNPPLHPLPLFVTFLLAQLPNLPTDIYNNFANGLTPFINLYSSSPITNVLLTMATSLATPSPDLTPVPAIAHPPAIPKIPKIPKTTSISSTAPSSNTSSDMDDVDLDIATTARARPLFSSTRKSSGTNIIPQDQPDVEVRPESFPPGDARAMSPRRTSVEMEKLGRETRVALQRLVWLSFWLIWCYKRIFFDACGMEYWFLLSSHISPAECPVSWR